MAACRRAGLDKPAPDHTVTVAANRPENDVPRPEMRFSMPVNKPCFALAFREVSIPRGDVRTEMLADMLPDLVCGGLTALYRPLSDQALVDPEFSGDTVSTAGCCVIAFTGESETPRVVADMVRQEIRRLRREVVAPELFTLSLIHI